MGRFQIRRVVAAQSGFTLLELVVTCGMLIVLASVAVQSARIMVIRNKEVQLRRDLREMRDAIDHYKDDADKTIIRVGVGTEGYPPDLETLVQGTRFSVGEGDKIRFLWKIPIDPMTGRADWGLRSVQDDPDSRNWGGGNVFDVYSSSPGTALDGTKYSDW